MLLKAVEPRRVPQLQDQRGKDRPAEGLHELIDVTPDLGIEAAPVRVERPDHDPVAHAEAQLLAYAGTAKSSGDAAPRNDFGRTGLEHPTLRDAHLRAHRAALVAQSTNDHVRRLVGIALLQGDQHDHFLRHTHFAGSTVGNFRLTFHNCRLRAIDAALHFRSSRAPRNHDIVRRSRIDQRFLQPFLQHQHGGEHEYHERHARGGKRGRHLARTQVLRCVRKRDNHD